MPKSRFKRASMTALLCGVMLALSVTLLSAAKSRGKAAEPARETTDAERVSNLLTEMESVDLYGLPALPVERFTLPEAGVDVMRVRMQESYDVAGVGKDTVELTGWIAVKHFNTRPASGETEVKWGTAVTDTEFVGMDLQGVSPIFGPVRVRLNRDQRAVGHVGRISTPFPVGALIDAEYRAQTGYNLSGVPTSTVKAAPARRRAQRNPLPPRGGQNERAVERVILAVLDGVSNKDPKAMLSHYDQQSGRLFFGMTIDGPKKTNAADHVNTMSLQFANIRSIKAVPNDDRDIRVSGNLATAALTGRNIVVNKEGQKSDSLWRWTAVLERKGNDWLITHDHIDFYLDPNAPLELKQLQSQCAAAKTATAAEAARAAQACQCNAAIYVDVTMPKLNLSMTTANPVVWYSRVDTIPPVGFTASVLVTPTPLVSDGRQVAILQHGAVKFREVVRHIPLREEGGDYSSR
jgi:ketosteroid isomerase-like protein